MKKSSIILCIVLVLAAISVSAKPITNAVGNANQTFVDGVYVPYQGNKSLIPVGAQVSIICNHSNEYNTISTSKTVVKNNGAYQTQTTSDKCTFGDTIQSCVGYECSEWVEVKQVHGMSGHGQGYLEIIGVPEYTTAAIAFLMLFTGGGIVYLRNKKR
ncbi:MAG: hypothetical protein U9R34_04925 [Nanoarchaeota archaeon]|nr:hypothetical protein [Nanoarchaeota archaeon]